MPRRDLKAGGLLQAKLIRSARWRRGQISDDWSRKFPARSAHTQRTCRGAPLKPDLVPDVEMSRPASGLNGKWPSFKYRDVSVKHTTTSPSHRDCSRQVVDLRVLRSQPHPNKIVRLLRWISAPTDSYSLARAASEAPAGSLLLISLVQRQRGFKDPLEKF